MMKIDTYSRVISMYIKLFALFLFPFCSLYSMFCYSEDETENCLQEWIRNEPTQIQEDFMDNGHKLSQKNCIPCRGGVPPLKGEAITTLLKQLGEGWRVVDEHHLEKEYKFPNFVEALAFTNKVGAVAEQEGHHPDIFLAWGKVKIQLWTHKINGLTESDFIMAAKCDEAL